MVDCFATINLSFGQGRIQVHKVSLRPGTDSASEVPEGEQYKTMMKRTRRRVHEEGHW